MKGVWLPLITPFVHGAVDLASHDALCRHYADQGIHGLILLGTTGEGPTVTRAERRQIIDVTRDAIGDRLPVYVGVGSNSTAALIDDVRSLASADVDGFLMVSPYYNRPPQDGILAHYQAACSATDKPVVVYNIAYRTGSNIENDTMLSIAASIGNVVAVKDSCGDLEQSLALIKSAPDSFSVLTGEDHRFFDTLAAGGAGGVLAAAHVHTRTFVQLYDAVIAGDVGRARDLWERVLAPAIPPLFAEPNPMPLKHVLWRAGLIESPECRLPLTRVSAAHADRLDARLPPI